ncbi:hypothetical protein, partial [Pseudoalteromonas atlantica]|uniref:hypothetical protein n=1 Tax=Pseudoalteromonas atlantica TaxID=288 RepID=UPI0037361F8E
THFVCHGINHHLKITHFVCHGINHHLKITHFVCHGINHHFVSPLVPKAPPTIQASKRHAIWFTA